MSGIPCRLCESLANNKQPQNYLLKASAPSETSLSSSFAIPCSTCHPALPRCHGHGSCSAMSGDPRAGEVSGLPVSPGCCFWRGPISW